MGRSPRAITLVEAFRSILRAIYPDRPALADEIQSYDWDYFQGSHWWFFETHLTSDEVIAVNKALELLDEFVVERGKVRLRGALGPSKPLEVIDPADVKGSKLDVFAGKLRVFDGNKHIKTYYRVHCCETNVNRRLADLRSETKQAKRTKLKGDEIPEFTKNYLDLEPKPTLTGIRTKWHDEGHGAHGRDLLDSEYRDQATARNISLKRGPKRILQK